MDDEDDEMVVNDQAVERLVIVTQVRLLYCLYDRKFFFPSIFESRHNKCYSFHEIFCVSVQIRL